MDTGNDCYGTHVFVSKESKKDGYTTRLIISNDQDSDGHLRFGAKTQMTYIPAAVWRSAVSVFMLVSLLAPSGAHAGVFSRIFTSLAATVLYTTPAAYNSQNIPLPTAARNIDPNPSKGGSEITIVNDSALLPVSGPSGSLADVQGSSQYTNHERISIYVVRPGDTLGGIAKMFDVSVNTIRWGNNISRKDTIRPGQELVILPMTGIKYTVKTGGSLRDIIKKYGGNLTEAVDYNGYGADQKLSAGTEVVIPNGELQTQRPRRARYSSSSRIARTQYARAVVGYRNSGNLPEYRGYFMRPITGGVRTQGIHGHNAVDLASTRGTPVMAAASGTVIIARNQGWNGGYGKYVVINHPNGTQTLYSHASKVIVTRGQKVVQGQVVEYMGSTGKSTGPHVHFEVHGAKNPF